MEQRREPTGPATQLGSHLNKLIQSAHMIVGKTYRN